MMSIETYLTDKMVVNTKELSVFKKWSRLC